MKTMIGVVVIAAMVMTGVPRADAMLKAKPGECLLRSGDLCLTWSRFVIYTDRDGGYIEGEIRNTGHDVYRYAEVDYVLYDAAGHQVGDAMTNTRYLAPGVWRFTARFLENGVRSVRLAEVAGHQ